VDATKATREIRKASTSKGTSRCRAKNAHYLYYSYALATMRKVQIKATPPACKPAGFIQTNRLKILILWSLAAKSAMSVLTNLCRESADREDFVDCEGDPSSIPSRQIMNRKVAHIFTVALLLALAFATAAGKASLKFPREDHAKERLASQSQRDFVRELRLHTDYSPPGPLQRQQPNPRRKPPGPHYHPPPICPSDQKPQPHNGMEKTTRSPTPKPRSPKTIRPTVATGAPKSKAPKGVETPTRLPTMRPRRPRTAGRTRPLARPSRARARA
jgi:hypothetical protein